MRLFGPQKMTQDPEVSVSKFDPETGYPERGFSRV
jgi:hypothetical protein